MADRFEIFDKEYPLPQAFRMGDPVLVEEVTGLTWGEFSDRMDDADGDPAIMLGMLAVAVWQTNPRWRRDKVARYVEGLKIEDVKFVGEEREPEANPPVNGSSPKDVGSSSGSGQLPVSTSDTNRVSTTPDGLPPTIPASV